MRAKHSRHDSICGSCRKHCKCLDSLHEHLLGPLAKKDCSDKFAELGCRLCLSFFANPEDLKSHSAACQIWAADKLVNLENQYVQFSVRRSSAIAIDCEMVGGGRDGFVDLCARVCIVDENENVLLNTHVRPPVPVTNYRSHITGIAAEDLVDAIPLEKVRKEIMSLLVGSGFTHSKSYTKLLVGHDLKHDLSCLNLTYPSRLIRDTALYPPLLRTNGSRNKLRYLVETYLGYQIQTGKNHDPCEDAVAAMRLYKRMQSLNHKSKSHSLSICSDEEHIQGLTLDIQPVKDSRPQFYCWCQDASITSGM
ncbi:hypothetical protein O6H91_09G053000 [Diphasiastrum complanatum]|uniref:Uncharacterized protein n=5 Tax=Diphasiastrum complanatum TaxID=34168 RepID=A0ACC2CPD6_DIPCM|nr:hypothetical protein O6H91_09G053000 [Diphasiastrum complanatum]KAJ7543803.1 hypothetical protein O6H91_09G053000 [Diphasiastrum complanatum]KAJ7543804.1 hypothetical protein O6H91_09G053000 [Diphasiastrum complanatum]KAJ7543805.1 hypothetical protein O6H91_09G053000 [Diphasiastrum complanatum]KAJ7543806.1 hypothetical protein O6H91_09G053000 [Diphasiastrum complanatum]